MSGEGEEMDDRPGLITGFHKVHHMPENEGIMIPFGAIKDALARLSLEMSVPVKRGVPLFPGRLDGPMACPGLICHARRSCRQRSDSFIRYPE
jgi:hypothetical protein